MSKTSVILSLMSLGLVVIVSFLIVSSSSVTSATSDESKAVLDVLMLEAKSFETGDMDTLNKIWSHDDSVLIFESGGVDKGWKNYRDHHLAPELKAFMNTTFNVTDTVVKVEGNTAWATYKYALKADYKDQKVDSKGLGTMVFEKSDGAWLIVHSHTSATRKPAS